MVGRVRFGATAPIVTAGWDGSMLNWAKWTKLNARLSDNLRQTAHRAVCGCATRRRGGKQHHMPGQEYELEQQGALVVAAITSDKVSYAQMQEMVNEMTLKMRYDNARHFILDMSQVAFLSSACLGALVGCLQDLEPMHGRIVLACCCDEVAFVFKVTRLDRVFPIFDDVADARAELLAA